MGGSQNFDVFYNYDAYVAKFQNKNHVKTTDDTYTPDDVFDAVVKYVGSVYDLRGKEIIRPFYPGGDYENYEYPDNGVVIDNPPFSIASKICRFYAYNKIPFFLFFNGLTVFSVIDCCTVVVVACSIKFTNGAEVCVNFASNLYGDIMTTTAPELNELLRQCKSQKQKAKPLKKYVYPREVLSVNHMQQICRRGIKYEIKRWEGKVIREIGGVKLFGKHMLISSQKAEEKEKTLKKTFDDSVKILELGVKEKRILDRLNIGNKKDDDGNGIKEEI